MLAPRRLPLRRSGTIVRGAGRTTKEDPMTKLSEKQAELFRGKNWGTVVTLREDGSPHATPVWIDTDGENVLFNTAIGRAKERHLRRDPRVSVTVLPAEN